MPLLKAVILIAGPQKGTRFRPLSLDVPKPLFPVAGLPIVQHHIEACAKVQDLREILILGFYPTNEMANFVSEMNRMYESVSIRYLQEFAPLGTAGGLYHFRDQIRAGNPDAFFVMNGDVCSEFPLEGMLELHRKQDKPVTTVLGTEATRQQSVNYGCIVEDKTSHSILHFVEKPKSYISTIINCGVYIFSLDVFQMLQNVFNSKQVEYFSSSEGNDPDCKRETIWVERDVLVPLAGTNKAFLYLTNNWWSQIKTAGSAIYANRHFLALYNKTNPERLTRPAEGKSAPTIIGDVFIHETATVDQTAVLGPNVSIGKNVKVGAGTRIKESIVLGNSQIGEHSLVLYSVVGWNSTVGSWSRVEGTPEDPNPNKPFAKMENNPLFNINGQLNPSITILGSNVVVPSEIILLNSIVLPHKELGGSCKNQIIFFQIVARSEIVMSGAWQQCVDTNTGQPYYWNTASNQVSWDCPPEFSLPPPQLITNISLATPSNPVTSSTASTSSSTVNPGLSSLVSGYDSEDSDDDQGDGEESQVPGESEAKDDLIRPVIPKQSEKEKESHSKRNIDEADDILSLIEAEKPPDYAESKAKLPSCKTNSRDTKESVQATSMLALANYEDSDSEPEPGIEAETGTRLDQFGRLVFNPASSSEPAWQTAEQREALLSYRREEEKNRKQAELQSSGGESEGTRRFDNSRPGARKRRLDLPKGKFNKTENLETETENEKQSVNFVPFVKSSSVLPGTIESNQTDNGIQKVEESATETEQSAATDDVGELTAEIVEKMEHFKVGQEKVSALKTVAIKLETLYSAWTSGALSLSYLQSFLQSAMKKLIEAESSLTSPPRAAVWDRDSKSYHFLNEKDATNCTNLTDLPSCSPTPPPPPPEGSSPPPLPPSPPPPATGAGADHQVQDMDIEEEPTGNITDQLSMFYSEIEGAAVTPSEEEAATNTTVENYEEESNNSSAPSSPPASPLTNPGKKRKKVKVSNNLALKKKGVGDMLVKWQKIKR